MCGLRLRLSSKSRQRIGGRYVRGGESSILYEGSCWVVYHGTSTVRLRRILEDGHLRTSGTDNPKISLTTKPSVAEYWACHAVFGDRHDRLGEDSSEVVLVLDGEGLLELNYDLGAFSDPIWGRGGMRLGLRTTPENFAYCEPDHTRIVSTELVSYPRVFISGRTPVESGIAKVGQGWKLVYGVGFSGASA